MRRRKEHEGALTDRTPIRVRFSEVDAMQVVWHGEYVRYFEDGREAFGRRYGIGYHDLVRAGYLVPIVELNVYFKQSLQFGETATVETRYIPCDAANIQFEYTIYRDSDQAVMATGASVQVFMDKDTRQLELNNPEFYIQWKKQWNIL